MDFSRGVVLFCFFLSELWCGVGAWSFELGIVTSCFVLFYFYVFELCFRRGGAACDTLRS